MADGQLIPNLIGAVAREDSLVPLERTEADGSRTPVLFWNIGGVLYVHPDRREKFDQVCSFIDMRGGADALTDEARAKFGFSPRTGSPIERAVDDLIAAQKRHREWVQCRYRYPFFEPPPLRTER